MKRLNFLLSSLLLCICCTIQAKNKVIEQPPFIVSSTTSIEVSKVEISDTATILHIYAKYRPKNWIKIAAGSYLKDNNGETYPLRSGIGITPDKEFWMPESGEAEFQLVFPPLPASVTSVDFTEGADIENGFSIWGIQLKGKNLPKLILPKEAVVHKVDMKAELPEPVVGYDKAILKGKLLDFYPGMSSPITLVAWESAKGDLSEILIDIQSDGSFSKEVPLTSSTPCTIYMSGSSPLQIFMEPGQTTEVYINMREISRRSSKFHKEGKPYGEIIYINGPLAAIAQELNRDMPDTNIQQKVYKNIKELAGIGIDAYKERILKISEEVQTEIDKLSCSPATRQLLTSNNKLSTIGLLRSAANSLTSAAIEANQLKREEAQKYYLELARQVPDNYIPNADFALLNIPQTTLSSQYVNVIAAYYSRSEDFAKAWGTDSGIFFDIARTIPIYRGIKDFTPITEEQKASLATLPTAYRDMVIAANNELLARIEANKKKTGFTVNEAGEVSDEDLFASIISKFSGKVLLVDFWATWCGPCRMANKEMIPMKEELKDKDIVYLYITGETSPLKTWENMIPDIHGEHYRVTAAQWNYLGKSFNISGVPTYLIIDREGNIKYRQVGFPGVNTMKEELLKVAGK
ncbi:TlpA disulfide reductase family protein [uncultured Bacteroides sp.]|uniref:TlpA family protein disulfide reductase n=1 Tax=uncultured Bacteroides sp. TaxID=162156 RepID=UPI0025F5FB84|nr:TlpA disulfide reductase family protein [uncultured Bacteroides sp.]